MAFFLLSFHPKTCVRLILIHQVCSCSGDFLCIVISHCQPPTYIAHLPSLCVLLVAAVLCTKSPVSGSLYACKCLLFLKFHTNLVGTFNDSLMKMGITAAVDAKISKQIELLGKKSYYSHIVPNLSDGQLFFLESNMQHSEGEAATCQWVCM